MERSVDISVLRLVLHTATLKPDAFAVALVVLGAPLAQIPDGHSLVQSLPKTIATSSMVQVGQAGQRDVVVDTGHQLQFTASTSYRVGSDGLDLLAPIQCETSSGASTFSRGLAPCKTLQMWLVTLSLPSASTNDASKKKSITGPTSFSCVAFANISLPLGLFPLNCSSDLNGSSQTQPSALQVPLYTAADKDRRHPVAVVSLVADEGLHAKQLKRSHAAIGRGLSCDAQPLFRARGAHSRRTTAANVAAGMQHKAQKLFEKMKNAFDPTSAGSSADESAPPMTTAESSLVSAPGPSKTPSAVSTRSVSNAPIDVPPMRTVYTFTVPCSSASDQSECASGAPVADHSLTSFARHNHVQLFDGAPAFLAQYSSSSVGAAVELMPPGSILFVCETHDGHARSAFSTELVGMNWPLPIIVLLVKHQDFVEDSPTVCQGLADVLRLFLARYQRGALPGIWFMCSDSLASECLAILASHARAASSTAATFGVLFGASPTLALGFDDLHRASLQLQGERTPPPRSTSVVGSLGRLQPLLIALTSTVAPRLELRSTFPMSCAVIDVVRHTAVETRRIYFSKCLHVLCARGIEVRYDATEEAPTVHNSKRRWTNVGRDPVLVGVYRFPCQGHFDYCTHPGSSPGFANGDNSTSDTPRPPPPLRMWTTRRRIGGLTVGSNALMPDFMCTSLYGQSFSCVEMRSASKRAVLSVFVDSDRPPTFDDDSNHGVPHLPTCTSAAAGDMKTIIMGVECSAVAISSFDVMHIPLFPSR